MSLIKKSERTSKTDIEIKRLSHCGFITVRRGRTVSLVVFQDAHGWARDHQNSHGDYVDQ